jgi:3-dehydroquinate synthase
MQFDPHSTDLTTVAVPIPGAAYRIHIGPRARRILPKILRELGAGRVALIADRHVGALHLIDTLANLPESTVVFDFEPGEQSKSLARVSELYDGLMRAGMTRGDLVVTLGGGVASDLGGFVAATWMRGMRFVPIPTTLEAAVDAAVGGKTGVNHPGGKNLVGAFHQPSAVVVDTECLNTLPDREFSAGMAESIKHALIRDADFFDWHERHLDEVMGRDAAATRALIAWNCRIKAEIVVRDERESGLRMILNFGHTIGHAIEHLLQYQWRHGECVSLGLVAAMAISRQRGAITDGEFSRAKALLVRAGLPVCVASALESQDVLDACRRDKKRIGDVMNFVLLSRIGEARRATDVSDDEIRSALQAIAAA